MKKTILISLLILFLFSFASSFLDFQEMEIPEEVQKILGNQKINLFLDEKFVSSIEIKDNKAFIKQEKFEKPTLEIYLKNETLMRISQSPDPRKDLINAYKSGEIRIVKKTFMNKLRFFFARFFIR